MAFEHRPQAAAARSLVDVNAGASELANRIRELLDPFNIYRFEAAIFVPCPRAALPGLRAAAGIAELGLRDPMSYVGGTVRCRADTPPGITGRLVKWAVVVVRAGRGTAAGSVTAFTRTLMGRRGPKL